MMINRNNYETYFLLYIDNELSDAERKAVEEFVSIHTDLQDELDQLKMVILPEDEINFLDKTQLFKSQAHDDLLQEKLLMHLDGELDKENTESLNKLLQTDTALKTNWEILQQTKLDASESIEFPYKDLLYRKERENVIIGRFVRWAVAAAILGIGFFAGVSILNKKQTVEAGEKTTASKTDKIKPNTNLIQPSTPGRDEVPKEDYAVKDPVKEINNDTTKRVEQKTVIQKENIASINTVKRNISTPVKKEEIENKEEPLMAINTTEKPIKINAGEEIKSNISIDAPSIKSTYTGGPVDTDLAALRNSFARTAGLTDATPDNNNDRILYMNEDNVSRSKAGIFFRKLKRVVERNTKIKTDKGLRIGGFEVAIK